MRRELYFILFFLSRIVELILWMFLVIYNLKRSLMQYIVSIDKEKNFCHEFCHCANKNHHEKKSWPFSSQSNRL